MPSYARILAHYPYVVLTAVLVVSITCLIVTVTIGDTLTFEEPMTGFEPRGTEISNRLTTYNNLINDPDLSSSPWQLNTAVVQQPDNKLMYMDTRTQPVNITTTTGNRYLRRSRIKRARKPFFCDVPDGRWAKVAYHSQISEDLFTWTNIQSMCRLEQLYITSNPLYSRNCLRSPDQSNCCRPLSLGNYIALLSNKPSCSNITNEDVGQAKNLVQSCVKFYQNFSLMVDCDQRHSPYGEAYSKCKGIPKNCQKYNAVYNIMHFISDRSFQTTSQKLSYALTFLPISFQTRTKQKLHDAIDLFLDIEREHEPVANVEIVAADFGIKDQLFHHYLSKDSKWLTVSGGVIFLIVWIFTGSIFITVMTFITMFWSLELAYFLYVFVLEIHFFPYMNLVSVLMVIAIGADDVFVYTKVWHLAKKERNNGTLEKLVSDTLKHAALSMFVTSLTTAGALFANIVSPITSIKCFSIYAGITIICNFLLMVTWTPAAIVIEEKWCNFCFINSPKIYKKIRHYYRMFFERLLPKFVIRLKYLWIVALGSLGIVSGVLVFHYPKMNLPTSFRFQVFRSEHLMEVYDQQIREQFWFEKSVGDRKPLLPVTIVWGVKDVDNGDKLNPHEKGTLEYNPRFNPATPQAQMWLRQFCRAIRETDFYRKVTPLESTNCFIEHFILYMKQQCTPESEGCCKKYTFPYTEHVFEKCINRYIPLLKEQNLYFWDKFTPGLKFHRNKIAALIVQFSANITYTYDYEALGAFYKRVNKWVNERLLTAPVEMRDGWFISDLQFYNIQKSLAEGVPVAFGISILVATVVTFFTSLNVLITVYAMITIAFIMLVTLASIVLLGWELNILESVIITVAVGLSIDHTLHYGVAYRLAPDLDRRNRVFCSLVRVGNVIFVAALTTFFAGLFMLPSVTLVYQKFGIFLMLVITISWVYSTLFFQSLLNVIGPQGGFGQFHWPSLDCCSFFAPSRTDRTVYHMSESTMSTSSSGYPYHPSIDTNATEHDYLPDRGTESTSGTPCSYRTRPGRRRKSESNDSPDNQAHSKLLNGEDKARGDNEFMDSACSLTVEVHDTSLEHDQKLCTEV